MARKSTWGHLVGTLPTLEPTYDEAMAAKVAELRRLSLDELMDKFNRETLDNEALAKEVKDSDFRLEALTRVIVDQMTTQGLDSLTTKGYRWTPSPEPYPQVTDKTANRVWAMEHMPDNLSLPFQTLKAVTKAALENNESLPAGVEPYMKWSLRRTKA